MAREAIAGANWVEGVIAKAQLAEMTRSRFRCLKLSPATGETFLSTGTCALANFGDRFTIDWQNRSSHVCVGTGPPFI